MKTLISFLGKKRHGESKGYPNTTYKFADRERTVPYFGLALADYLQPDQIILVGTAGSMWDVFFEAQGTAQHAAWMDLIDAVAAERADAVSVRRFEADLANQLGRPVRCLVIPYARDVDEQTQILHSLAEAVAPGTEAVLDITHGFRHLPMLALVAARYLTRVRRVQVSDIYYGALEMRAPEGPAPVLQLGGMLKMLDWVDALATYDKDGDYGVFAPLLQQDGLGEADAAQLKRAAFYERTNNPEQARWALRSAEPKILAHDGALGRLFRDELTHRIAWARQQTRADWELRLADAYLARRDHLRAVLFLYEAFATRTTANRDLDIDKRAHREQAIRELHDRDAPTSRVVRQLEHLRNTMAHGLRSNGEAMAQLVGTEEGLRTEVLRLRLTLFPEQPVAAAGLKSAVL